ncbi:MAG TPA: hypothetical protein VFI11_15330 [Anaerolineales bacterium]|nr:hypothetical protein [Anaerolineales bacterium]
MAPRPGRRWLVGAIAVFLVLLVGWVALALQLSDASVGPLPYARYLFSNLDADYGPDRLPRALASIRLTILLPAMRALGLTDEEAAERWALYELTLNQPVPTATALNFQGDPPLTATPTASATPTNTRTPTNTATSTATNTGTNTPTRTRTPTPTKTKTPRPTNTSAPSDTAPPVIVGFESISRNDSGSCKASWTVNDLQVIDPSPSSGIDRVEFKYAVTGYLGVSYLSPISLDCGGIQGDGSWDACYDGTSAWVEIKDGWAGDPPANTGPSSYEVILYARAYDNASHMDQVELARYSMPDTCDDPDF